MYKTMINKDVTRSARNLCQVIVFSAAAVLAVAPLAQAELVTNGSFEDVTQIETPASITFPAGTSGQINYSLVAPGWTVPALFGSYAFIFAPGTADSVGAISQYYPTNVFLWGPNYGGVGAGPANGLTATSPDGGNYLADDGSYQNSGPISQMLTGLTQGDTYAVTFYWAAAQQAGFTGGTSSGWQVNLGLNPTTAQSVSASIASEAFSGWMQTTLDFTADGTSDLLSFMALGSPGSTEPPFALLDGVSATDTTTTNSNTTPEPGTWILMLTGILGALGVMRSRQWMKR